MSDERNRNMADLPSDIGSEGSFLIDKHLDENTLKYFFQEGSFDPESVRHASYQLRLGNIKINIEGMPEQDSQKIESFQQITWDTDEDGKDYIEIKPRQRAHLYTEERFNFPDNVIGFVICRGLLFSCGFTPENTYVYPG